VAVCGVGVVGGGSEGGGRGAVFQGLHCSMISCMGVCVLVLRKGWVARFIRGLRRKIGGVRAVMVIVCNGVSGWVVVGEGWGLSFFCFHDLSRVPKTGSSGNG
jgi:hypothetical protein